MNLKRTMSQALQAGNLTPEEAFVTAGAGGTVVRSAAGVSAGVSPAAQAALGGLAPTAAGAPPKPAPLAHTPLPAERRAPVSVTFRLPAELPAALLRVAMERKLGGEKPFTQQDIVAEALRAWLEKHAPSGG